jgi:hypothetical protein
MSRELAAVTEALASLGDYVSELEQRAQALVVKTERIAEHLRDEDVRLEVIRPGDRLRVATPLLIEWIENAGHPTSLPVVVQQITVEPDGTKTLIVGARP